MRRIAALIAALTLAACAQHAYHGHAEHQFDDPQRWAKMFDDPARDAWQRPDEVLRALKLAPNADVADIGAGTGYFAMRLARAVPQGRVYAVDAEPAMVRYLGERATREGLKNIAPTQGREKDAGLLAPVDVALLVNTYHHIDARVAYFGGLKSALKPGARVAIIDFRPESPRGPKHKMAAATVRDEMSRAGFRFVEEHAFLPDQYFLVFAAN